jgi:nucleoside-diphosphate-sugar epimerase
LSRRPPRDTGQQRYFRKVDILDLQELVRNVAEFAPDEIVHLAARTDFVERDDPAGYQINTCGTLKVIAAAARLERPVRFVFASSNVVTPELLDAAAENSSVRQRNYAASKAAAERLAREDVTLRGSLCIVRPCYVWGPWFGAPFRDFFLRIARGRYFHPGPQDAPKLLGYVGNVTFQIIRILDAPAQRVSGRTFYLADYEPTTIGSWANLIARRFGVPEPRTLPEPLVRVAAWTGDLLGWAGYRNPPLTSARLSNMRRDTTSIPIAPTKEVTGSLPYKLQEGVEATARWMCNVGLIKPVLA